MNHNVKEKSTKNSKTLEKYIKAFVKKIPQIIVQARCGERKSTKTTKSLSTEIFQISVENVPDIQEKIDAACENIQFLHPFSISTEILLKTADGDTLALESWHLQMENSEVFYQQNYRMFADYETIFGHLLILLKSTISISRVLPSFKLSLRQSADTYVMLYRIYPGEPMVDELGVRPVMNHIGEVYTPEGMLKLSVTYRTKQEMTIAPQKADKENFFMVKSNYFDEDMIPKKEYNGIQLDKNARSSNPCGGHYVGAFAPCNHLPETFPELTFLEKSFLNLSKSPPYLSNQQNDETLEKDVNLNNIPDHNHRKSNGNHDKEADKLFCSEASDGSDFVFVDLKPPPFAACDSNTDLGAFFQVCKCAPPLSSLTCQTTLKEQVSEVTNQLAQFELSMSDFDSFVDSVCQTDVKK